MKKSWVVKGVLIALILVIVSVVYFYTNVPLLVALVVAGLFSVTVASFDGKYYARGGGRGGGHGGDGGFGADGGGGGGNGGGGGGP